MSVLDLQALETPANRGGGGEGGSEVSLTLCDSTASVLLCL
ncbi:MAG TPA: SapB/AmfS family lanthipeptide [Actinospica sp.]|jgi:hypothetical protein|nr:SapB/AmfS family lanthipeptide [Actinospica sp.]